MHITHLGHSCLLVETGGRRLLIDPGAFSADWHDLRDLDAVIITHQHPDHVDPEHVPALLAANPDAGVYVEPSVVELLGERAVPTVADQSIELDGVRITPVGGQHAIIHNDIPRVGNLGLLIKADSEPTLFHPGDAIAYLPIDVDVLAVPLAAPWCAFKETVEFVRGVRPASAIPIHDAVLSAPGRAVYLRQLTSLGNTTVTDLAGAGRSDIA